jgi:hypothetical protein
MMESQLIQKSFGAKKTKEPKQIIMIIISSKYITFVSSYNIAQLDNVNEPYNTVLSKILYNLQ